MFACPHCGQPGISAIRKSFLGPAVPTSCRACGKSVGVPYGKATIACMPLFASMYLGSLLGLVWPSFMIVGAGLAISIAIYLLWVPLVQR